MRDQHWQHFPHEDDIGIRGFGDTLNQAFEQAAVAMIGAITNPENVASLEEISISCAAPDNEQLLVRWLNSVAHEMATRKMLFGRFHVTINGSKLAGVAWGEPLNVDKHAPSGVVKCAEQTHLRVTKRPNGTWIAECVIDI